MATQPDVNGEATRSQTPIDQEEDRMPAPDKLPGSSGVAPGFDQPTTAQEEDPRSGMLQPGSPDTPENVEE